MTGKQVVETARKFLGTPFHHQGRLKGIGVDCIGLVVETARILGLSYHDNTEYSQYPDGKLLMKELHKSKLKSVPIENLQEGDLLVFWISKNTKAPQHLAIKTKDGILHTYATAEKVVEHKFSSAWRRRLCAVFRFPGVD